MKFIKTLDGGYINIRYIERVFVEMGEKYDPINNKFINLPTLFIQIGPDCSYTLSTHEDFNTAYDEAAKLIEQLESQDNPTIQLERIDKSSLPRLDKLGLSARALNCLKLMDIRTFEELYFFDKYEFRRCPNLGKATHKEILDVLEPYAGMFDSYQIKKV